jgi:hypothetical protein
MKTTAFIAFFVITSAPSFVYSANLLSPSLITPRNNEFSAINKPLTFTWGEPKDPSTIKNYHLIISKDERFTYYNQGTKKCDKAANCADFIVNKPEFVLASTHAFLQKKSSFFWQVQAIGKNGNTSLVFQGSESASSGKENVRKQVNIGRFSVGQKNIIIDQYSVEPQQAANGSAFKFTVKLDDELSSNQHLKIKIGEEDWREIKGSGLNYTFRHVVIVPVSINAIPVNYQLAIFSDTGEILGNQRYGDFTVLSTTEELPVVGNIPPTVEWISGSDSVSKTKTYTVKFKANDDDDNLARIEVNWGDGSATDSKSASSGATLSFSHIYKFSGVQEIIATAFDKLGASAEVSKSVTVITDTKTLKVPNVANVSVSPNSVTQGNSATFSARLSADLPTAYSVKINYGNGLIAMSGSGTSFSLSATPTDLGSGIFTVGIYDKNTLKSNQLTGNFSVIAPSTDVKPDISDSISTGERAFNYTKIANDGSVLPADAKLGANPKEWACTKDNSTGLIWEIKTNDDGLRDKDWSYSWYEPDEKKNGGFAGYKRSYEYANWCKGSECDINDYAQTVNESRLCGAKDWRVPTKDELVSLIYCSDGQYDTENGDCVNLRLDSPTIDKTYFPNTAPTDTDLDSVYWTFSLNPINPEYAWDVIFTDGTSYGATKRDGYYVRLVRNTR